MYLQIAKKVFMEISTQSFDDTAKQLLKRFLLYERVRWPINAILSLSRGKLFSTYIHVLWNLAIHLLIHKTLAWQNSSLWKKLWPGNEKKIHLITLLKLKGTLSSSKRYAQFVRWRLLRTLYLTLSNSLKPSLLKKDKMDQDLCQGHQFPKEMLCKL